MSDPVLCVSWNNHSNELAAVCKNLMDNNCFVDCTIAAEGRSLKAHRLILSACSPYFQMLFSEEKEKYPIIILKDTLFYSLKAVIDFVYNGKAEIPAHQFEGFLELAVSLQIKGLNNSLRKDRNTDINGRAVGKTCQCTSRVNEGICEVDSTWTSHQVSSNSSQKHRFHHSHGFTDIVQSELSVPFDECCDSTETVQSRAVVSSQCQQSLVCNDSEASIPKEIGVIQTKLCSEIEILEASSGIQQDDPSSGNFRSEMSDGPPPASEHALNQNSWARASFQSTGNSGLVTTLKEQSHHYLQQKQQQQKQQLQPQPQQQQQKLQVSPSSCELSSPLELTEQHGPLVSERSSPLSENADDAESDETMDAADACGSHADEMNETRDPVLQQNLDPRCVARKSIQTTGNSTLETTEKEQSHHYLQQKQQQQKQQRQPQQQQVQQQPQQQQKQQFKPSSCELSSPLEVAEQHELLVPQRSSQVSKNADDAESDETMDAADASGSDADEIDETREPVLKENLNPCSGAAGSSPELDGAAQRRNGGPGRGRATAGDSPAELQVRLARMPTFTCSDCGATFASSQGLSDHARQHSAAGPLLCAAPGQLAAHKPHHSAEGASSCDASAEASTAPGALAPRKRRRPGERPYSCDVCGKGFSKAAALAVHKRWHSRGRQYSCNKCAKVFPRADALLIHKRSHTGARPSSRPSSHVKNEDRHSRHKRLLTERPYSCDVCQKTLSTSSSLTTHKRTHTGERPYSCNECEKTFSTSSSLTTHKRTHTGDRPYSCDVCGKAFSQHIGLSYHKRTHTGERPYSCDECEKTFSTSSSLITHKRIHTGDRPYSCDVCGKAFTQSTALSSHKRIHTGERPFSCDVCGKTCSTSSNLTLHKRIHTGERPFSCDVCEKTFSTSTILTTHKRIHTGERPYSCDMCGKSFSQFCGLSYHKRSHTGERAFGCDACSRRFPSKTSFTRHWRRTHATEGPSAAPILRPRTE